MKNGQPGGLPDRPLREGRVTVKQRTRANSTTRRVTVDDVIQLQDRIAALEGHLQMRDREDTQAWETIGDTIERLQREVDHLYWYCLAPTLILLVVIGATLIRGMLAGLGWVK